MTHSSQNYNAIMMSAVCTFSERNKKIKSLRKENVECHLKRK